MPPHSDFTYQDYLWRQGLENRVSRSMGNLADHDSASDKSIRTAALYHHMHVSRVRVNTSSPPSFAILANEEDEDIVFELLPASSIMPGELEAQQNHSHRLYELLTHRTTKNQLVIHHVQSSPQFHRGPIEYRRPEPSYAYLEPSIPISIDDLDSLRLDTLTRWERRHNEVSEFLAYHPAPMQPLTLPVIIWRDNNEYVFLMKTAPHYAVRPGDQLECFGLMSGVWKVTSKKERYRDWRLTKKHDRLRAWVYCWCRNDETQQQARVKMPAEYFYPPPITTRVVRKLGSWINLRSTK
ncbi:hypothetical protein B0H19DRAFT_1250689 [Mycena capillaripes]|nr:hypothetical protein B0H19DRAFT_1250689 [Mycena capillaripes]